jgi:hypothetical protein
MRRDAAVATVLILLMLGISLPARAERPTAISVTPASGVYGGSTSLQATLTAAKSTIPNETISFTLNGVKVGTATTNSIGVATLNNASLAGINTGEYSGGVTAVFAGDSNFRSSQGSASLTVNRAPLTVTTSTATKLQGQPNPAFSATYSGLLNGDTPANLGGTLTFNTTATTSSPAGMYTVTPGGLTSSNYVITFVSGLLLVQALDPLPLYAYVTDQNIYTPQNYTTFQPPAVGGAYIDTSGFYTPIKRISDSMHTPDVAAGNPSVVTITTEYSTMSPFNEDNSRLILVHLSYFGLYDGAGNFLGNLPLEINASAEPRWSRTDPKLLYYVHGNQLKEYNVGTSSATVVHTFSEYSAVSGKGKSDISFDGNHFVLVGDGEYVFVYEISTDSKGSVFDTAGVSFNNVAITPNNNVAISWTAVGSSRSQGVELFDSNMNFLRQVVRADGHFDLTRDTNGDEVMVWVNANDPAPICNNGVVKVRLADATQTCLATFNWSLAMHVSATDNSGWVFVETYAPGDPIPPNGWFTYTDELMQVKLDGSQVRRFAHHRSRPFNSYTWQPKLSISRDGGKLAYASNFSLQQILGNPTEYSDAYSIDISVISTDTLGTAY